MTGRVMCPHPTGHGSKTVSFHRNHQCCWLATTSTSSTTKGSGCAWKLSRARKSGKNASEAPSPLLHCMPMEECTSLIRLEKQPSWHLETNSVCWPKTVWKEVLWPRRQRRGKLCFSEPELISIASRTETSEADSVHGNCCDSQHCTEYGAGFCAAGSRQQAAGTADSRQGTHADDSFSPVRNRMLRSIPHACDSGVDCSGA